GVHWFEKSQVGPRPRPREGKGQARIEKGIVAQRGKVLRVLTQDTEVFRGPAELEIFPARCLAGNPAKSQSVGYGLLPHQRAEQTKGAREPPAQAADERTKLLLIKFGFVFQPAHARVERGKLEVSTRRVRRAVRKH